MTPEHTAPAARPELTSPPEGVTPAATHPRAADAAQPENVFGAYPRLVVRGAAAALAFYREVFGAATGEIHLDDKGRIIDAQMLIGGIRLSVRDEGYGDPAPPTLGGTPVIMALEVSDPDLMAAAMLARGAAVIHPVTDHPYGRAGRLADPYGHQWMLLRPAQS
ncbi:PhnB protein [Frankia sp. AiPs1]